MRSRLRVAVDRSRWVSDVVVVNVVVVNVVS